MPEKLFTHFKVAYYDGWKHSRQRSKSIRVVQQKLATGIWRIHIDLGIRCCAGGGGGGSDRGGLKHELLMFDQGGPDYKDSFAIELFYRGKHYYHLVGQVSKDYWYGFAVEEELIARKRLPCTYPPRKRWRPFRGKRHGNSPA